MIRCPKCDEELEVQEADPDVGNLRAKLDIAISALEFARDGYERIDIKHIEYRVGVYTTACDALDKIALPSISNHQPHAVSQGWQGIETAPRDGTPFIGAFWSIRWADSHRRGDIVRCWYQPEFDAFISSCREMTMAPGYTINGKTRELHSPRIEPVTHWMPLPSPPSKEGE